MTLEPSPEILSTEDNIGAYWEKIEQLPLARLQGLITGYQTTLRYLEEQLAQARIVGMTAVIDYTAPEVERKKVELDRIQAIVNSRTKPA